SRPIIVARPASTSDLIKLKNLVDAAGHPAVIDGDLLRVDAGEDWSADLNRLAFENNILLRQLTPVRPNLEETFFEMTEEK
ncbi:MAG: multidrug ABC transporter ATP-binding protein, partial [Actinomycetota bacterium]